MIVGGIDVGKSGALCLLDDKNIHFVDFKTKGIKGYIDILKSTKNIKLVTVELVHSMPKQGVKSMFSFGENYGLIQGVLQALDIPFILVKPQTWQKALNIPSKSDKKKIASIISNVYPKAQLYGLKGGLLDGRSDALCLVHYAKLYYKGQYIE